MLDGMPVPQPTPAVPSETTVQVPLALWTSAVSGWNAAGLLAGGTTAAVAHCPSDATLIELTSYCPGWKPSAAAAARTAASIAPTSSPTPAPTLAGRPVVAGAAVVGGSDGALVVAAAVLAVVAGAVEAVEAVEAVDRSDPLSSPHAAPTNESAPASTTMNPRYLFTTTVNGPDGRGA